MKADIGFVGMAVMGENLVLNMERNGFSVALFNKETEVVDRFLAGRGKGKNFAGTLSLKKLVESLDAPRTVMMMIKAGSPVDEVTAELLKYMEKGDLIVDGGNSNHADTQRRVNLAESKGVLFVGTGISGGEEGALNGPSIMPGGSREAWPRLGKILTAIAAKGPDGTPCCEWIGPGGSGHYVKMIHNGIEYGDMQIVSEAYWLMQELLGLSALEMHDIFSVWNRGKLDSYLVQITSDILKFTDTDGSPLLARILDTAGQKGTGKWTVIAALEEGMPLTLITESVFARSLSAQKESREQASRIYPRAKKPFAGNRDTFLQALHDAVYCAKIVSYAQGFELILQASKSNGWNLDPGGIARLWRGGCIIRSVFLDRISDAFARDPALPNLILDPYFSEELKTHEGSWRTVVAEAVVGGLPVPALASALGWFDGYRSGKLPANMIQAQRDYFGAHTYERTDAPRGRFFHTDWTGHGGQSTSGSYTN